MKKLEDFNCKKVDVKSASGGRAILAEETMTIHSGGGPYTDDASFTLLTFLLLNGTGEHRLVIELHRASIFTPSRPRLDVVL